MKKVIKAVSDIVLAVVTGFALLVAGCCLSGVKPYIVLSGSMEPAIRTGSVCFVDQKVSFDRIKPGDVIAFETASGQLVTHRVVAVDGGAAETRGDANRVTDGCTTTEENFRGKALFSIPYVGYAIRWFQTARGRILGITGVVTLFIGSMLTDEIKKRKAKGEMCGGGEK